MIPNRLLGTHRSTGQILNHWGGGGTEDRSRHLQVHDLVDDTGQRIFFFLLKICSELLTELSLGQIS